MLSGWVAPLVTSPLHIFFPAFSRAWLPVITRWSIFDRAIGGDLSHMIDHIETTLKTADPTFHLHTKDGLNESGFSLLFVQTLVALCGSSVIDSGQVTLEFPCNPGYADCVLIDPVFREALVIEFKYVRFGLLRHKSTQKPIVIGTNNSDRRDNNARTALAYFNKHDIPIYNLSCRLFTGEICSLLEYRADALRQANRYAKRLQETQKFNRVRSAAVVGYGPRVTWIINEHTF